MKPKMMVLFYTALSKKSSLFSEFFAVGGDFVKKSLCLLLAVCLFGLIAFRLWNSREDDGPIPVVIDADPGIDDAFALMAAAASDRLEILGITTVHGNVSLAKTSINALKLACWLGIDCPVAIGAEYALDGSTSDAIYVHGANGLGNVSLPAPTRGFDERSAVELLHDAAIEAKGELQILAIGPLTNIATWITEYPQDLELIDSITVMGGSQGNGNTSTYGEFNAYADPKAAGIVYGSGVPITMVDYSITQYNYVATDTLRQSVYPNNLLYPFITALCDFLDNDSAESGGITLHDLQAAMLLIHPGSARTQQATVTVPLDVLADHRGETIVEFNEEGNVRVLRNKKNAARIQSYVVDVISAFDGVEPATNPAASPAATTGWARWVCSDHPALTIDGRQLQLETLFLLEETGTPGAVVTAQNEGMPPVLELQGGEESISLSAVSSVTKDETTAWCYLADSAPDDPQTLSQTALTLTADGTAFPPVFLERQDTLFQTETGLLLLPLDSDCHALCTVSLQENRQVAAPVLTGQNGRAQTTCAVPLPASGDFSLDLICAPFAAKGLAITGMEYEGFYQRVVSQPLVDWNPAQLPDLQIQPNLSLSLTAARTKTDAEGTPCIRGRL